MAGYARTVRGVQSERKVGRCALTEGRGDKEDWYERAQTARARQAGKGRRMACVADGGRSGNPRRRFKAGERPEKVEPPMMVG